jgi:hypothetical protein
MQDFLKEHFTEEELEEAIAERRKYQRSRREIQRINEYRYWLKKAQKAREEVMANGKERDTTEAR